MYTDLYLRFSDEAESRTVLYRIEGAVEADPENGIEAVEGYEVANYANIDTIGVIYEPQEIVDPENPPEPVAYDGWHVNVRVVGAENAEPLQPFAVVPESPRRVWG
jgi:septum formation inhibitor-activating ATPase MinD